MGNCYLCRQPLGAAYQRMIIRDVEVRGNSEQMHTTREINLCKECSGRFARALDVEFWAHGSQE